MYLPSVYLYNYFEKSLSHKIYLYGNVYYNTEEIEILEEQATLFTKIAMGLGVLSVVLFGIIIALLVKNRKKKKTTDN